MINFICFTGIEREKIFVKKRKKRERYVIRGKQVEN